MCRYKSVGLDKEGCELADALQLGAGRVAEVLNQSLGKPGFHQIYLPGRHRVSSHVPSLPWKDLQFCYHNLLSDSISTSLNQQVAI